MSLLSELKHLGVVLTVDQDRLLYDAPVGVLTDELLERMRSERESLRASLLPKSAIASEWNGDRGTCPWCGPVILQDERQGLRCTRCRRLAWLINDGSMMRTDCVDLIWDAH